MLFERQRHPQPRDRVEQFLNLRRFQCLLNRFALQFKEPFTSHTPPHPRAVTSINNAWA